MCDSNYNFTFVLPVEDVSIREGKVYITEEKMKKHYRFIAHGGEVVVQNRDLVKKLSGVR